MAAGLYQSGSSDATPHCRVRRHLQAHSHWVNLELQAVEFVNLLARYQDAQQIARVRF